jgi:hypothetical protein
MVDYLSDHGLSGMNPASTAILLDDLLNSDRVSNRERRLLLLDHERLAAEAQFFLLYQHDGFTREDETGLTYLTFRHGEYACDIYDSEEFLDFLREEPEHLASLTELVREALFSRFAEDAAQAAP